MASDRRGRRHRTQYEHFIPRHRETVELPDQKRDEKDQYIAQIKMDLALLKALDFDQDPADGRVDPWHEAIQHRIRGIRLKMTFARKITGGFKSVNLGREELSKERRE